MRFNLRAGSYVYRPLRKGLSGWDCFAIQKCIIACGYPLERFGADGFFGDETDKALRKFQEDFGLAIDGIAGPVSMRILVTTIAKGVSEANNLPAFLQEGQIEHESSYLPGNYTAPYEDKTRDLGVVMMHKSVTDANCEFAFDAPNRIDQLARFLRTRHDLYWKKGENPNVKTHQRAWELAVGAWNAPAWADTLARGGTLSASQQQHIQAYWEDCLVYVRDYGP